MLFIYFASFSTLVYCGRIPGTETDSQWSFHYLGEMRTGGFLEGLLFIIYAPAYFLSTYAGVNIGYPMVTEMQYSHDGH
jgi:hypothetical protein